MESCTNDSPDRPEWASICCKLQATKLPFRKAGNTFALRGVLTDGGLCALSFSSLKCGSSEPPADPRPPSVVVQAALLLGWPSCWVETLHLGLGRPRKARSAFLMFHLYPSSSGWVHPACRKGLHCPLPSIPFWHGRGFPYLGTSGYLPCVAFPRASGILVWVTFLLAF